ncbi:MAG: GNAT family N-acetyltransferase [Chloroflexi bacterium]|nr:GNAT family N-acetyltransferase [Chloroflexota bacterium]
MRTYQGEDDFWRMREFLRQVFMLNGRREVSWHVARLDYWCWHVIDNCQEYPSIEGVTFIWETDDGQIVAVLNPEGKGEAHLQVHPGLRTPELEEEMLDVAEQRLAASEPDRRCTLRVWAGGQDDLLQKILARRGYTKGEWPEYQHCWTLAAPVPDVPVAPGYTVRSLGDASELPARSWASWKGFHPDEPDERYGGWEWYHNIQRMPLYRRDLDIVAVAPGGEIAAFCTFWYDDVTRSAYIEPVATVTEHQRRGLGKAVICEGLRRLQRMGGTIAFVGGYSAAARALYSSVGTQYGVREPWVKAW